MLSKLGKLSAVIITFAAVGEILRFLVDYQVIPRLVNPAVIGVFTVVDSLTQPVFSTAEVMLLTTLIAYIVWRRKTSHPRVVLHNLRAGFRDSREEQEISRALQFEGVSVVAARLIDRYGPGFEAQDYTIIQAILLHGRSTVKDLATYLTADPQTILRRLNFMEVKGLINLVEYTNEPANQG